MQEGALQLSQNSSHNQPKSLGLRVFSLVVTIFFALGSGMVTALSVKSLPWIAALPFPIQVVIMMAVACAEILVAYFLYKEALLETLDTLASAVTNGKITKGLTRGQKAKLALGFFCALGAGFVLGALTYVSAMAVFGMLFKGAVLPITIVAGLLAVAGFIAYSGMLFKWIAKVVRNDTSKQVKGFFKKIFTRNKDVPLGKQILQGMFKLMLVAVAVAATVLGTIALLGTMHQRLSQFLEIFPHANYFAISITSIVMVYVLVGIARLPWAMSNACEAFSDVGEYLGSACYEGVSSLGIRCATGLGYDLYSDDEDEDSVTKAVAKEEEQQPAKKSCLGSGAKTFGKILAALVHGFSLGALAESGGGQVLTDLFTDMHLSHSPSVLAEAGQSSSLASGGVMSVGIAGAALFAGQKAPPEKPEKTGRQKRISPDCVC